MKKMSIRTLPKNLIDIFCNTMLNFKIIVKMIIGTDNNFCRNPLSINGLKRGKCFSEMDTVVEHYYSAVVGMNGSSVCRENCF